MGKCGELICVGLSTIFFYWISLKNMRSPAIVNLSRMTSKQADIAYSRCSVCDRNFSSNECVVSAAFPVPLCVPCQARAKASTSKPASCAWCGTDLISFRKCQHRESPQNEPPQCILLSCGVEKCRRKYCTLCINKHFGSVETRRIHLLERQWKCFSCDTSPLISLSEKKWQISFPVRKKKKKTHHVVNPDITNGRERNPIPVVNDVDDETPFQFTYVPHQIGLSVLKDKPDFVSCCSCTDNCADKTKCECALASLNESGHSAYDSDGYLKNNKVNGIYECNFKCKCNMNQCRNRVVGRGTQLPIEIFRCTPSGKGWGVRCSKDVEPGVFIACYTGEVIEEDSAEKRGLKFGDEYLFNLDAYGRSRGCQRVHDLGLKVAQMDEEHRWDHYMDMREKQEQEPSNPYSIPVFLPYTSESHMESVLGADLASLILKSSSVRTFSSSDGDMEVQLMGSEDIQRRNLKSLSVPDSEQTGSGSSALPAVSKKRKSSTFAASTTTTQQQEQQPVKSAQKLGNGNGNGNEGERAATYRKYCSESDKRVMEDRCRVLIADEARWV